MEEEVRSEPLPIPLPYQMYRIDVRWPNTYIMAPPWCEASWYVIARSFEGAEKWARENAEYCIGAEKKVEILCIVKIAEAWEIVEH